MSRKLKQCSFIPVFVDGMHFGEQVMLWRQGLMSMVENMYSACVRVRPNNDNAAPYEIASRFRFRDSDSAGSEK
jgi:hypothetical protein